jgi:cardiolipin-specific phospholipase
LAPTNATTINTMSMFWSSALQTATKLENLKQAEAKLLEFAKTFGTRSRNSYNVQVFDTKIPRSCVPLKPLVPSTFTCCDLDTVQEKSPSEDILTIHGVQVQSQVYDKQNTTETPLVLLHGYMNASAYFYRNWVGLSQYYQSIYAIDLLGWGLSSRPPFDDLLDDSLQTAEDFFVESLEHWRIANKLDRMILAGHSMGGYIAVAYCERYPQQVERLILLSPVGVPDQDDPQHKERQQKLSSSLQARAIFGLFQTIFATTTLGSILRTLPSSQARNFALSYVLRRLPEIADPIEQEAVADYLFHNNTLPGSAEHSIQKVLDCNILARKPLQHRVPLLQVEYVNFMYGTTDWMPVSAGLATQALCEQTKQAPECNVHVVRDSGHLFMLQNPYQFNAGLIHASGGLVPELVKPVHMKPATDSKFNSILLKPAEAEATEPPQAQTTTQVEV